MVVLKQKMIKLFYLTFLKLVRKINVPKQEKVPRIVLITEVFFYAVVRIQTLYKKSYNMNYTHSDVEENQ